MATGEASASPGQPNRGWIARLYGALSGAVGTIAGITPHVLHHVGPVAGAAVLTGTGGSILFGAIGFAVTVPLLLRLRRRFGSWLAPGIALAIFAAMFIISTIWIGPAVRDAINGDDGGPTPVSDPHHARANFGQSGAWA
ncbi:MAG: hypothetical protein ABIP13_11720 [Tepidiformaceae bacterium]